MKKPIKVLSDIDVSNLFNGLIASDPYHNRPVAYCRARLLLLLMLHAGLRVGETVQLFWSDIIFCGVPAVHVQVRSEISKTKVSRAVPMDEHLQKAVLDYYNHFKTSNPPHLQFYVFQSRSPDRHLSVRQVQQWLVRMSETYCTQRVTPHMLRHTFATRMMSQTSSRTVQILLGHKRLSSTEIYLHPTMKQCIDAVSSQKCL